MRLDAEKYTGYLTSDNEPDGIAATHSTFEASDPALLCKCIVGCIFNFV
jgi:hypothetical protein